MVGIIYEDSMDDLLSIYPFFSYLINRIQLFEKECVKRGKDKRTYIISEGW